MIDPKTKRITIPVSKDIDKIRGEGQRAQEQMEVADMKKDIKAWAIKIRGRNFYSSNIGVPHIYKTHASALEGCRYLELFDHIKAEPVRVRVRIEEIE